MTPCSASIIWYRSKTSNTILSLHTLSCPSEGIFDFENWIFFCLYWIEPLASIWESLLNQLKNITFSVFLMGGGVFELILSLSCGFDGLIVPITVFFYLFYNKVSFWNCKFLVEDVILDLMDLASILLMFSTLFLTMLIFLLVNVWIDIFLQSYSFSSHSFVCAWMVVALCMDILSVL